MNIKNIFSLKIILPVALALLAVAASSMANAQVISPFPAAGTMPDQGEFNIKLTITDANTSAIAVNGFWIDRSWINRVASMSQFANVSSTIYQAHNLVAGDRLLVSGAIQNGTVYLNNMQISRAQDRNAIQNRINELTRQVNELIARLRGTATSTSP